MLSDEQVQELYAYCKRKNILYYDVQVEIVDHMANAIESLMETRTELTFKQALEEVHASFGSFGLTEIVVAKTNAMRKHYNRMSMQLFKTYFTPPKLLLTVLLITVMVSLERLLPVQFLEYVLLGALLTSLLIFIRFERMKKRLRKKQIHQLLMTDKQYFDYSIVYFIVFTQLIPRVFKNDMFIQMQANIEFQIQYYFYGIVFILYSIGTLVKMELYTTVTEKARKEFPGVFCE